MFNIWNKLPPTVRMALISATLIILGAVSEAVAAWIKALPVGV